MFKKFFSLFAALTLSVGLWAANSVITFTSTGKLYPGSNDELKDNSKWEAFKAQFPEFAEYGSYMEFKMMMMELGGGELSFFNPNAFLDANGQVLPIVEGGVTYDESTKIGTITFAGELVTIKDGDINNSAFLGNESLTSITLPEGLVKIGKYSFYECRNLTTVNIPASLTTIGNQAFDGCGLTSVNFAAGSQLTTIESYAFNGCQSLATITIPASVTEIKWIAFRYCSSLTDVYVAWTTTLPTLGNAVFENTPVSTATLHVPAGTKTLYQNADQWKDFGSIVEPAPTPVSTTYLDENGEEQNISAWEVKDASAAVTWGTAGQTTWFVVKGTNVQLAKGAICAGDVRLILADNAKLTATGWLDETDWIGYAGIQVSGPGNSLTIYAQSTGEQMGQLIANGDQDAAGIGGGQNGSGTNITINGGIVTANGGMSAAGIGGGNHGDGSNITINGGEVEATGGTFAAGIGGGMYYSGSNITINGGEVTATGGMNIAGIGGGMMGSAVDIFVATDLLVKASSSANPTTVIAHTHTATTDIATDLADKQYAKIILGFVLPEKTAGQYATICLPRPMTGVTNGTLFKISHGDIYEVNFVEEADFTADPAGTPYLVQAIADGDIVFDMKDVTPVDAPIDVQTAKGFVASLQEGLQDMPEGYNYLLVSGGVLHSAGPGCQLSKNHAYIDINYVPAEAPAPQGAPRRVVLYNAERQMPTGLYQTQDTKHGIQKLLRNGQLLIIRENKVYNAQGQIVK